MCQPIWGRITLARLFHGFNCRGEASIFKLGLTTNRYALMAFGAGVALLAMALFVPFVQPFLMVAPLSMTNVASIVGLAFAPTLLIQIGRVIRELKGGLAS